VYNVLVVGGKHSRVADGLIPYDERVLQVELSAPLSDGLSEPQQLEEPSMPLGE
jgi:hypothetical protein